MTDTAARAQAPAPRGQPRRRGRASGRDHAGAAIVGFAVAVAIYAIVFVVFMNAFQAPAGSDSEGTALAARADGGLDTMLNTMGQVSPTSTLNPKSWKDDPDNITRFGLAPEGMPGHLDLDKLRNLTRGGFVKATNDLLDYEEARAALGLGEYDFHLRSYPLLSTLDEAGAKPVRGLDVVYVGDFGTQGGQSTYYAPNTTSVQDKTTHVFVNVTVTNDGPTSTVFQAEFKLRLKDKDLVDTANTMLLGAGDSDTLSLKLLKTADWEWKDSDKNVSIVLSDPSKTVGNINVDLASLSMTTTAWTPASDWALVKASPGALSYRTNQQVRVYYDIFDGDGNPPQGQGNQQPINVTLRDTSGAIVRAWQGNTGGSGKVDFAALPAGLYNITVNRTTDAAFNSTDRIHVSDTSPGDYEPGGATNLVQSEASIYERSLLADLVDGWVNASYNVSGDVYPDSKKVMNGDLATNLSAGLYNILIVGSNVDHNAMTSEEAKSKVRDFVLAGGLLVVLGSGQQQVTWLQPLFHASLSTSGDGVSAPDPTHPILHTPEELQWQTYPDNGHSWEYNSNDDQHFTHVLVRDGAGKQKDILGVSKPGHFGNGTIVLSGWQLFALTQPQDAGEAKRVFYNFLLHALGALYIDFGPAIPDYVEVASSSRMATAPHPAVKDEEVLVRLVLYVFR